MCRQVINLFAFYIVLDENKIRMNEVQAPKNLCSQSIVILQSNGKLILITYLPTSEILLKFMHLSWKLKLKILEIRMMKLNDDSFNLLRNNVLL